MTKKFWILSALFAVGLTASVPAFAAEEKDPVAARVNGQEIHYSDIQRQMQQLGPRAAQMPQQILVPQLLEKLIVTKLVAAKGYADKLEKTAEAKDLLKQAEEEIVADLYVRKTIEPQITDDKIKKLYQEKIKDFKPETEIHARHILVPTKEEADKLLKDLKGGADFAKLAKENSKDTGSAKNGGDLGFFTKEQMVKPFADAAFSLKPGEMTKTPVKTRFGYHIIKVEESRKTKPDPLEAVKTELANEIGHDMLRNLVAQLQKQAKVERFNPDGSPMQIKGAN